MLAEAAGQSSRAKIAQPPFVAEPPLQTETPFIAEPPSLHTEHVSDDRIGGILPRKYKPVQHGDPENAVIATSTTKKKAVISVRETASRPERSSFGIGAERSEERLPRLDSPSPCRETDYVRGRQMKVDSLVG